MALKADSNTASLFNAIDAAQAQFAADPDVATVLCQLLSGDELWLGQQHLAYGPEDNWPFHRRLERTIKAGGTGVAGAFAMLAATGHARVDADSTAALSRMFTGNDLWNAQQLLAYGALSEWPKDLQVERELRNIGGVTNWAKVMALMVDAATPEFSKCLSFLSLHRTASLLGTLQEAAQANFGLFMEKMDQAQTLALLDHASRLPQAEYGAILARIKTSRMLATTATWVNKLHWNGGSFPDPAADYRISLTTTLDHRNDFAHWLRSGGKEPDHNSTMNCWEALMFMAYCAGLVQKTALQMLHHKAAMQGSDAGYAHAYLEVLKDYLGEDTAQEWLPGPTEIPAGNLIFIDDDLGHVLMSKGTRDSQRRRCVYSMWKVPDVLPPNGFMQDTTLEQVLDGWEFDEENEDEQDEVPSVKFNAAPW